MEKKKQTARDIAAVGIFASLIAICSWIAIPTAVPLTLQTLAVFTAMGVLGGKNGTAAIVVYILLGTIGVPVFAGFTGGIGVLLGKTGGYIVGFLFSALLIWGAERLFGKVRIVLFISMIAGLAVCYAVGTVWFLTLYTQNTGAIGIWAVLSWCVFPFIIPDLIKIAAAVLLSERLRKVLKP